MQFSPWAAYVFFNKPSTVEPRFNEPLYSKVLDITNDILRPFNSKMYEKVP